MFDLTPRAVYRRKIELLTKECERLRSCIESWKRALADERSARRAKEAELNGRIIDQWATIENLRGNIERLNEQKREADIISRNVQEKHIATIDHLRAENRRLNEALQRAYDDIEQITIH